MCLAFFHNPDGNVRELLQPLGSDTQCLADQLKRGCRRGAPDAGKAKGSQDTLSFPTMLNAKLSFLAALAGGSESGPAQAQEQLCEDLAARVEEQVRAVDVALAEDLSAFNALVRSTDVPAIVVPEGAPGSAAQM